MELFAIFLCLFISYLLGSMPTAIWLGKGFFGRDVRDLGSGNAGAANTFRVLGKKAGIAVLFLDIIKGLTAVSLVRFLGSVEPNSVRYINLQLLFGVVAVLGHIFPIYAKFKGGKGIATLFGMVIGIHYLLALACLGLFFCVLFLTRYVSLSSILAVLSFPLFALLLFNHEPLLIAFGVTASILVILTHQKNIVKLINGEENKAKIFKKHRNV